MICEWKLKLILVSIFFIHFSKIYIYNINNEQNTIEYYANILNEIYKSFIISIKNQKNPRVIAGSKDSLLSMKNFFVITLNIVML